MNEPRKQNVISARNSVASGACACALGVEGLIPSCCGCSYSAWFSACFPRSEMASIANQFYTSAGKYLKYLMTQMAFDVLAQQEY